MPEGINRKFNFSKQEDKDAFYALSPEEQARVIDVAHEEALALMLAEVAGLEYTKGGSYSRDGIRGGRTPRVKDGSYVLRGGYGSFVIVTPATYILSAKMRDEKEQTQIEMGESFRNALDISRLTERVREALKKTTPKHIALVHTWDKKNNMWHLAVDPDQLTEWAAQARAILGPQRKRKSSSKTTSSIDENISAPETEEEKLARLRVIRQILAEQRVYQCRGKFESFAGRDYFDRVTDMLAQYSHTDGSEKEKTAFKRAYLLEEIESFEAAARKFEAEGNKLNIEGLKINAAIAIEFAHALRRHFRHILEENS